MRIIIIGSKGFIGKNLSEHYRKKGYDVWGADIVTDYIDTGKYYLLDAHTADFNPIFEDQLFDICVNCSGAASVPESIINPLRDYNLNTVNVYKILESIKKHQPECRFINLSSAAVYGNPQVLPVKESSETDPLSPYGFHKLLAEQICKEFYKLWNLKTCSLRIFSVYGAGLKKQLFWDIYNKVRKGVPFTLFGTGNESRDFINASDLVKAIDIVAERSDFKADIINVANGEEIFIRDAVSAFAGLYKIKTDFSFSGDTRKGDPLNWKADISKLRSLGYNPSVDLKSGLAGYIEWIEKGNFE